MVESSTLNNLTLNRLLECNIGKLNDSHRRSHVKLVTFLRDDRSELFQHTKSIYSGIIGKLGVVLHCPIKSSQIL